MQKQFSFEQFQFSSKIIRDLVTEKASVSPFVDSFFSLDKCHEQVDKKTFLQEDRELLVKVLKSQYNGFDQSERTKKNIDSLLDENTYTITTGHQLNFMTGPLYSLYKILQVIVISEKLNSQGKANYVPVFWMATEDHDFEEINHLFLYGEKIAWEKENQEDVIAGEIILKELSAFKDAIRAKFKDDTILEKLDGILNNYKDGERLSIATRGIVNQLFGDYGLVILDGNDPILKNKFQGIAQQELESQVTFEAVSKTNQALKEAGYHQQVYLRNVNLFLIDDDNKRSRIAVENGVYKVGEQEISKEDLLRMLAENAAAFSPNALLRPVYQEAVLPNIAYVGGGGEIAYWAQIKVVFEALNMQYPLLRVRDSFVLMNEKQLLDLDELNLSLTDLKRDYHDLIKEIALEEVSIEIELDREKAALKEIEKQLKDKVEHINIGLMSMVEAEFTKMEKSIDRIESKMIKAEKSRHDQKGKKIQRLQSKVFPNNGFQERSENFLMYYFKNDSFIERLYEEMMKTENEPYIRVINI